MPTSRGPCRDFLEEFSSFVDGSLDQDRRTLLLAHLDCCEACLRHLTAYRKGIAAYRAANAPVPVWGLYDRVMERLGGEVRSSRTGDRTDRVSRRGFRSGVGVGAAVVMAVVAMLVFVPPAGLDFPIGSSRTLEPTSEAAPPSSWASVIPAALPALARVERRPARSAPSAPVRTVADETGLQIDRVPIVPRREVRVLPVNDIGRLLGTSGSDGWSPRRPPVTIQRAVSVMPAAWVAEAALRIP